MLLMIWGFGILGFDVRRMLGRKSNLEALGLVEFVGVGPGMW